MRRGFITAALLFCILGCMGGRTLFLDLRYEPLRVPERPFLTETPLRVLLFPLEYKGQKGDELGSWLGFRGARF
jgi:hypothetical protein